jgi:ribulose-5-phosphate 4-epimerase/fuculose-1-phosphate aldolase
VDRFRRDLIATARRLRGTGLVHGTSGNVSVRTTSGMAITPTRVQYDGLAVADLVDVPGPRERDASREAPIHRALYSARPDAHAIVHAHPVCVTAWTCLPGAPELDTDLEDAEYVSLGRVLTCPRAAPGSEGLARAVVEHLPAPRKAVCLARHGALTVGATLDEAFDTMLLLERLSAIALLARAAS